MSRSKRVPSSKSVSPSQSITRSRYAPGPTSQSTIRRRRSSSSQSGSTNASGCRESGIRSNAEHRGPRRDVIHLAAAPRPVPDSYWARDPSPIWDAIGNGAAVLRVQQMHLAGLALNHLDGPFVGIDHVEDRIFAPDLDEPGIHAIHRKPTILIGDERDHLIDRAAGASRSADGEWPGAAAMLRRAEDATLDPAPSGEPDPAEVESFGGDVDGHGLRRDARAGQAERIAIGSHVIEPQDAVAADGRRQGGPVLHFPTGAEAPPVFQVAPGDQSGLEPGQPAGRSEELARDGDAGPELHHQRMTTPGDVDPCRPEGIPLGANNDPGPAPLVEADGEPPRGVLDRPFDAPDVVSDALGRPPRSDEQFETLDGPAVPPEHPPAQGDLSI